MVGKRFKLDVKVKRQKKKIKCGKRRQNQLPYAAFFSILATSPFSLAMLLSYLLKKSLGVDCERVFGPADADAPLLCGWDDDDDEAGSAASPFARCELDEDGELPSNTTKTSFSSNRVSFSGVTGISSVSLKNRWSLFQILFSFFKSCTWWYR